LLGLCLHWWGCCSPRVARSQPAILLEKVSQRRINADEVVSRRRCAQHGLAEVRGLQMMMIMIQFLADQAGLGAGLFFNVLSSSLHLLGARGSCSPGIPVSRHPQFRRQTARRALAPGIPQGRAAGEHCCINMVCSICASAVAAKAATGCNCWMLTLHAAWSCAGGFAWWRSRC
jgi:hypothetical protein